MDWHSGLAEVFKNGIVLPIQVLKSPIARIFVTVNPGARVFDPSLDIEGGASDFNRLVVVADAIPGTAGNGVVTRLVIPFCGASTPSTTTLSSSANPSVFGQNVPFTASVTASGSATPGGAVTFLDGNTQLGPAVMLTNGGPATFMVNTLSVGTHTITAQYSGDTNFASSTSAALSQTVNQAGTSTTLTFSPNPASPVQTETLTAAVAVNAPGFGTPSGTVTFFDNGTALTCNGGNQTVSAGQATCQNTFSMPGSHPLLASYLGDANFASSTGASTLTVLAQPPPAVITDNENTRVTDTPSFPDVFDAEAVKVSDAVTVTPLINVAAPVASYSAGSLGFGNVAAGQTGTQSLTLSDIGQAPLVVSSAAVSQNSAFSISQITCSNSATSLPTTLPVGGACIFLISYLAPSGVASSDTLTFTDNAALSNVASTQTGSSYTQIIPLNGAGSTTPPPPPPPAGIPVVDNEAIHVTDTPSFPDVFDSETITVSDQVTIKIISSPTTTSISAASVTYRTAASATVSVNSSGGTVTGNVTLSVDGGAASSLALSGGSATFSLGVLSAGNHNLAASFAAQGAFDTSSATGTITISQASSTVTVSCPATLQMYTGAAQTPCTAAYKTSDGLRGALTVSYTNSTNVGTAGASASYAGDANHAGSSGTGSFTIIKANQTITLTGVPASANFGQGPFTLNASATSGLTVALIASGNCLLSANSLSLTGVGSCTVTATQPGNGNYNPAPTLSLTFAIGPTVTTTNVSVSAGTVQYSDYTTLTATITPISAGGQSLTGSVQFSLNGTAVGSPVAINASGVATLSQVQVNLAAGSYPVKAVFTSANANFTGSTGTTTQNVAQENAFILYSGDTIAQVGTTLNLRATVWDSAAAGYPGVNPESGPTATIGDITKMWIAFDIYPAGSCGSGTPSTLYAQVALTGTAGIGVALTDLSSSSEVSYCVSSRLGADNTGGTNLFYTAPNAQGAGLDFYVNSGQFATGGGWVNDPTGSHGNFGFNARYNSTGWPKGQMVYVYRALYNGVLADFIYPCVFTADENAESLRCP